LNKHHDPDKWPDLNRLTRLQEWPESRSGKILFVGIGNVLRSDDGVGVFICRNLKPSRCGSVLVVETGIENYIGKINRSDARLLILVDCVDFGREPGYYDLLPAEDLADLTVHTHSISLKMISELFRMPAWILGIQPADTTFGEELSGPVRQAADAIIQEVSRICRSP
jgi:hydrogenase maturation protease